MKEYKHDGETFHLDDSEGCYVKVEYILPDGTAYHQTGYAGVNVAGDPDKPYTCFVDHPDGYISSGMIAGNYGGKFQSMDDATRECCRNILVRYRKEVEHGRFDPESACHDLHEWFSRL